MFAFVVLDIVSSVQKAKRHPGKNVSEINSFVSSGRKTKTHKMAKGMTRIGHRAPRIVYVGSEY